MSRKNHHPICRNIPCGNQKIIVKVASTNVPNGGIVENILSKMMSDIGERLQNDKCDEVPVGNRNVLENMNYSDEEINMTRAVPYS